MAFIQADCSKRKDVATNEKSRFEFFELVVPSDE